MSAPAIRPSHAVLLRTLSDYEPCPRTEPPDPAAPARPLIAAVPPLPAPPAGAPVWNEPGPPRQRLRQLICSVLEALDGRRTLGQVRHLVVPAVYEALRTRHRQSGKRRHRLRTLHTCRPAPDTVELCATVTVVTPDRPPHPVALAARLVRHADGWRCTVFRPLYPNHGST